jgi:sulfhydrogenase subunit beta (sulfur reductase)
MVNHLRVYKMKKENLKLFFERLSKGRTIIGPKKGQKRHKFDTIENFDELVFNYERTILPMKKELFLTNQTILEYKQDENRVVQYLELQLEPFSNEIVYFGLHPCDIHGIRIQDQFFMYSKYTDPFYKRMRENCIIIGHSCIPDEKCVCNSTKTENLNQDFDIFFNELNSQYLVWIGTQKADELIIDNEDLFEIQVTKGDLAEFNDWVERRELLFRNYFDVSLMPKLMELSYESDLWEKLGEECLACGACTNVCPTCSCYDIEDSISLSESARGIRLRSWDSCMFPEFSEVAGGENFRYNKADRLKLYYTHKLKGYQGKFEEPSCVGCGRCIDACPVDINILRITRELMKVKP